MMTRTNQNTQGYNSSNLSGHQSPQKGPSFYKKTKEYLIVSAATLAMALGLHVAKASGTHVDKLTPKDNITIKSRHTQTTDTLHEKLPADIFLFEYTDQQYTEMMVGIQDFDFVHANEEGGQKAEMFLDSLFERMDQKAWYAIFLQNIDRWDFLSQEYIIQKCTAFAASDKTNYFLLYTDFGVLEKALPREYFLEIVGIESVRVPSKVIENLGSLDVLTQKEKGTMLNKLIKNTWGEVYAPKLLDKVAQYMIKHKAYTRDDGKLLFDLLFMQARLGKGDACSYLHYIHLLPADFQQNFTKYIAKDLVQAPLYNPVDYIQHVSRLKSIDDTERQRFLDVFHKDSEELFFAYLKDDFYFEKTKKYLTDSVLLSEVIKYEQLFDTIKKTKYLVVGQKRIPINRVQQPNAYISLYKGYLELVEQAGEHDFALEHIECRGKIGINALTEYFMIKVDDLLLLGEKFHKQDHAAIVIRGSETTGGDASGALSHYQQEAHDNIERTPGVAKIYPLSKTTPNLHPDTFFQMVDSLMAQGNTKVEIALHGSDAGAGLLTKNTNIEKEDFEYLFTKKLDHMSMVFINSCNSRYKVDIDSVVRTYTDKSPLVMINSRKHYASAGDEHYVYGDRDFDGNVAQVYTVEQWVYYLLHGDLSIKTIVFFSPSFARGVKL